MKQLTFILVAFIALSACKKGSVEKSSLIQGKWELVRKFGGGVLAENIYPAGNGNLIQFSSGNFTWHVPGQAAKAGTYALDREAVYYPNTPPGPPAEEYDLLYLYSPDTTSRRIYLTPDTLILNYTDSYHDGFEYVYTRR